MWWQSFEKCRTCDFLLRFVVLQRNKYLGVYFNPMSTINKFEDIEAWQLARRLSKEVYALFKDRAPNP